MEFREWDIDESISKLQKTLGLELSRKYQYSHQEFEISIRPMEIPSSIGFRVLVSDDYLGWRIRLEIDEFAKSLMQIMKNNFHMRKDSFRTLLHFNIDKYERFTFKIDGLSEIQDIQDSKWNDFELEIFSPYFDEANEYKALENGLGDALSLILLLCTSSETWEASSGYAESDWKFEGSAIEKIIQSYERSRFNRSICLKFYGFKCRGCGNLLEEIYGPIGAQVIHVHHIVPVSQMNGGYVLNPIKDLIPLCPNCHNIVHRQNPPLQMSDLRSLTGFVEDI